MLKDAEAEYQQALKINQGHAPSLAGLGEIYYRGGNLERGVQYWEMAVQADQKTIAARNNLAWHLLGKLRATDNASAWRELETEATGHLSRVLAVDNDNVEAYVLYALVYMEGSDKNKSRLDIANVLLEEGAKRNEGFAPLWNARGLLELRRDDVGRALTMFERAVQIKADYPEARLNVGNIVLGFRKYEYARDQFQAVLATQPKNYDAQVGLGIALRGLGDLDAAEAAYKQAAELDPQQGDAVYNLGVLYKDFRASSAPDEQATLSHYKQAAIYFKQFLSKPNIAKAMQEDAKEQVDDCDKYVKQLEEIIQQKKQQPEAAPAEPAAADVSG
jgi:tetratricopeptide (TPR) repeat protein